MFQKQKKELSTSHFGETVLLTLSKVYQDLSLMLKLYETDQDHPNLISNYLCFSNQIAKWILTGF